MKKKILSLALVVAVLASMLVFAPTSGATSADATVAITKANAAPGSTVTVDLVVTMDVPLHGLMLAYGYDSTKLALVEDGVVFPTGFGIPVDKSEATAGIYENSALTVLSWAKPTTGAVDATNGYVVASLTFEVLEGATGEAAVEIYDTEINYVVNDATGGITTDIEYISGGAVILPEGYVDVAPSDAADFDIEDGVLYEYFPATAGTVVIPSDVTVIEAMAFNTKTIDTIIVPATVEEVVGNAFYRFARYTEVHIYVLGNDTVFNSGAFVSGSRYGTIYIHAAEGSTASQIDVDGTYVQFVPTDLQSLTVGDATYLVPSETTVPGVTTTDDGKVIVGWKNGDDTYAPGADITLTGATTLEPVTITAPAMNAGAGLKVADTIENCKMRFTTDMAIADYQALASLGTVTMGTIITPAKYVKLAGGLTKEALGELSAANGGVQTYIDVVANGYFEKSETTYTFAGSLAGFRAENINLEYAAAFYVTVALADGSSFTVYTDFDYSANRSVGATIDAAVSAGTMTDTIANGLKALIAANTKED